MAEPDVSLASGRALEAPISKPSNDRKWLTRERDILAALAAGEGSSGELARRANMNAAYTGRILGSLAGKGLAERFQRDHDYRFVYYRLTDAGRAALQQSEKAR